MDANSIRELSKTQAAKRKQELSELNQRLAEEKARAIARGKRDGKEKVYQEILTAIKKEVKEFNKSSYVHKFREDDRNYLEAVLETLIPKLRKEGFQVRDNVNIQSHYTQAGFEMDYGHYDESWRYTCEINISW